MMLRKCSVHLPVGDSGTRLQDTLCPGHRCGEDFTSRQLGLSQPTLPMSATLNRATNTNHAGSPQVHITSIPDHQHICKVQESTPDSQHAPSHTIQTIVKRRAQHRLSSQHRPFTTVLYGLDRVGCLTLILGLCRCVDDLESKGNAPDIWGDPASFVFVARLRVVLMGGVG